DLGLGVHVLLDADYAETSELRRPWSVVDAVYESREFARVPPPVCDVAVPAVPPFYWPRYRRPYRAARSVPRPPDALFYANEPRWYLSFAHALGFPHDVALACALPIGPRTDGDVTLDTVVLAPGCKTGIMAA